MAKDVGRGQQKIMILKRRRIIFVTLLTLTAFSSMLVALSLASFLPELTVENISVVGTQKENPKSISAFVESFSSSNLLAFFSGRNVFLLRPSSMSSEMLKSFPRLENVNITRRGLTSLEVSVEERNPVSVWCPKLDSLIINSSCFASDQNGFLFSQIKPYLASTSEFVVFNTPEKDRVIGDYIEQTSRFKDFGYFLREMKALSLGVTLFVIENNSLILSIKSGGKIIIDSGQDLSKILKLLESLKNNKDLGFGTDSFMKKLDYFDLRYSNKAVYKFKSSTTKDTASSTISTF